MDIGVEEINQAPRDRRKRAETLRRAPSNASALYGPCRKVTVEENLRSEEEVAGGGMGNRSIQWSFR